MESNEVPMNYEQICKYLPHRPPLILVDRVLELEAEKSIHAIKCISAGEPVFEGHFPGNPIFPGVYIIEGLAQTSAIMMFKAMEAKGTLASRICLLTGVDEARFRRQVVPGDVLHYHVKLERLRAPFAWFTGTAMVDGEVVAEVKFNAMVGGNQRK